MTHQKVIRLNRNESGLQHPKRTMSVKLTNRDLCNYGDTEIENDLLMKLGNYTKLAETHIMITNGSTDILRMIVDFTIHSNRDEVVCFFPTYIDFIDLVKTRKGTLKMHQITAEDRHDLNDSQTKYRLLEGLISPQTKLIYLCSPNNPIDFTWDQDEISYLCEKYPDILILVDQAYYEFQNIADPIMSWSGFRYQNLMTCRSFSKAYGLAGMRLGYLGAHPELLRQFKENYKTKQVNSLVKRLGITILDQLDIYQTYQDEMKNNRKWLSDELNKLGFKCSDSQTNFLLVDVGTNSSECCEYLAKFKPSILVKDLAQSPYKIQGHLRISITNRIELTILIEALTKFIKLNI